MKKITGIHSVLASRRRTIRGRQRHLPSRPANEKLMAQPVSEVVAALPLRKGKEGGEVSEDTRVMSC